MSLWESPVLSAPHLLHTRLAPEGETWGDSDGGRGRGSLWSLFLCSAQPGGCQGRREHACPQPLCLLGVYAFGFLFMLPQLFVNYKVRRAPDWRHHLFCVAGP